MVDSAQLSKVFEITKSESVKTGAAVKGLTNHTDAKRKCLIELKVHKRIHFFAYVKYMANMNSFLPLHLCE